MSKLIISAVSHLVAKDYDLVAEYIIAECDAGKGNVMQLAGLLIREFEVQFYQLDPSYVEGLVREARRGLMSAILKQS